jgi:hypothetical protein
MVFDEDINKIEENIYIYLQNYFLKNNKFNLDNLKIQDNFYLYSQKISENLYKVSIIYKNSHSLFKKIIYRNGIINENENNKNILYKDSINNFQIENFYNNNHNNYKIANKKKLSFKSDIIEQLIQICLSYILFKTFFNQFFLNILLKNIGVYFNQEEKNQDLKEKYNKVKIKYENYLKENNINYLNMNKKIDFFMNNFNLLLENIFPKNSNFQSKNNFNNFKEMNLIGIDFISCLNENFINNIINIDSNFKNFQKFINISLFEEYNIKLYYYDLISLYNLFQFLNSINNLDFNKAENFINIYEASSELKQNIEDDIIYEDESVIEDEEDISDKETSI